MKKELTVIAILTIWLAFMDISGLPSVLFVNIRLLDIEPFYWTFMFNFIVMILMTYIVIKFICPRWTL